MSFVYRSVALIVISALGGGLSVIINLLTLYLNKSRANSSFKFLKAAALLTELTMIHYFFKIIWGLDFFYFVKFESTLSFNLVSESVITKMNYYSEILIFNFSFCFNVIIRLMSLIIQIFSLYHPISNGVLIRQISIAYAVVNSVFITLVTCFSATVNEFNHHNPTSLSKILIIYVLMNHFLIIALNIFATYKIVSSANSNSSSEDDAMKKRVNIYVSRLFLKNILFSIFNIPLCFAGLSYDDSSVSQGVFYSMIICLFMFFPAIQLGFDYILLRFVFEKVTNIVNQFSKEKKTSLVNKWEFLEVLIFNDSFSEEFSSFINYEFLCCVLYGLSEVYGHRNNRLVSKGSIDLDLELKCESYDIKYYLNTSKKDTKSNTVVTHDTQRTASFISDKPHSGIINELYPCVFDCLRKLDMIEDDELSKSFSPELNRISLKDIKESDGKSGSFFFFTYDKRYIIKTISDNELNTVGDNFLSKYLTHMTDYADRSIIAKIYGMFNIVISNKSKINMILMQNLLLFPNNLIFRVFDLKGSLVDRLTQNIASVSNTRALKDLDFLWMNSTTVISDFSSDAIKDIDATLEIDLLLLQDLNLMDYSLLMIVIKFPEENDPNYESVIEKFGDSKYYRKLFKSKTSKYIYCFGIIDYLQEFNFKKFLENKYKSVIYGEKIKYVSSVDPINYSERMKNFVKENVLTENKFKLN